MNINVRGQENGESQRSNGMRSGKKEEEPAAPRSSSDKSATAGANAANGNGQGAG